jgi:4-hydroxybenzoate polyprenyltransferase
MLRLGRARKCARQWHDLVVVHRLEYPLPITYLCYAGWGACFATGDIRRFVDAMTLVAIGANLLMILGALALNTAADIRTDDRHREKRYLARAALRIGRRRTLRLGVVELAAGLALAVVVSAETGRWAVAGLAAAAGVLHLLYNVEPVRLKRRGLAGPVALGGSVVGLPFLLSYCAVRPGLEASAWPVLAGVTVLAIGRTSWWSVPDRAADTATGITTPTVRHGAVATLTLSCLILAAGVIMLGWGLWWRYGPGWMAAGTLPHFAFLAGALATRRRAAGRTPPSATIMRRHAMPVAAIGELAVAVLPFVAG